MTLRRSALRRRKPERTKERPQLRVEAFKKFVRKYHCLIEGRNGHVCEGAVQFAHVRMGNDGSMSVKPSDCHGVPLCWRAHLPIQHQHGEPAFERTYSVKLNDEANRLWQEWLSDTEAGQRYRNEQASGMIQIPARCVVSIKEMEG